MEISIVIVSYNATPFLDQCLQSCQKALAGRKGEILVIDNHSPEKVVESLRIFFPGVKFYPLQENLGFAKANNFGVEKAKGHYVLILNPDTIIPENLFDQIIPFYQKTKNIGALGVKLIDAHGRFHPESKRNLPTPFNALVKLFPNLDFAKKSSYYNVQLRADDVGKTTVLVGAFMFLSRSTYLEAKGFDERYFMYGEDIDLSYSIERLGYENYYKGDTVAIHYKGESTRKDAQYYRIFFQAMNLFIDKYYTNIFSKTFLKIGVWVKYRIAIFGMKKEVKKKIAAKIAVNELNFLPKNFQSQDLKNQGHYVFDTRLFSYQEIIMYLEKFSSSTLHFYIATDRYLIGENEIYLRE
ncbi:glycosyltransferase family 2 protein [Weeksella virosa]|uniref:glycosyltransferase family 2 protein n=1 Tax=Weeksella virosa TaxID=1014 RepID=UPI00255498CB|nr:glycosyltransferase family 2 protein [Weeksella virosa]MDK7675893.1 glycosyltransferase family 2 protein [Weeksella virosa]